MLAMVFTVMISFPINHTSLNYGLSLGVDGKLYIALFMKLIVKKLDIFVLILYHLAIRFSEFGGPLPQRPVQDLAFAVARFIQKGGSFFNYYMVGYLINFSVKQNICFINLRIMSINLD
jgi:hypothetical protein